VATKFKMPRSNPLGQAFSSTEKVELFSRLSADRSPIVIGLSLGHESEGIAMPLNDFVRPIESRGADTFRWPVSVVFALVRRVCSWIAHEREA